MQRDEFRPPLWYVVDKWVVWGASISAGVLYFGALAYLMRRARRRGTLPLP